MARPQTKYARSGDVHLAYQVIGDGPRDLVLVLDWVSQLEVLWEQPAVEEFVSSLARLGRVIWFDMRGVGLSDRIAVDTIAPEEWMEDVGTVMDATGSERATIVAHGHAVQMALLFAATHPDRVASLVLLNGFARLSRADDYPAGFPASARETVLGRIAAGWGAGTGRMPEFLAPSLAGQPGVREWWGRLERHAASPGTALAKMRASFNVDIRDVLPLVVTPTLVVHARENAFVRVEHGRYLAEHIAGATLVERESADHWPLPEPDLLHAIEEFVTGSRHADDDPERFLATVLVVDVAGSTGVASALGDRHWTVVRDRFEETVRVALERHGGELVSTAGDGVLATFAGPARAIRCALGIRDEVRQIGLDVRCGLHAGEVTRRASGVAGIALHIAARVCALAEPGEVRLTRTVRDLVAGSGLDFEDRGEHALKGVPDAWTLYAASG